MQWKEPLTIPDGKHKGKITRVEKRTEPYEYTDIFVKLEDIEVDIEMKYGCPTVLSKNSKLGRLCMALGAEYKKDEELDIYTFLPDKKIVFMTMIKKAKDGNEYAEIIVDSIKLQENQ